MRGSRVVFKIIRLKLSNEDGVQNREAGQLRDRLRRRTVGGHRIRRGPELSCLRDASDSVRFKTLESVAVKIFRLTNLSSLLLLGERASRSHSS